MKGVEAQEGGGRRKRGGGEWPTVDEKKEGPSLISHSPSDQGLPSTRRAIQQNATRWLHSDGPEQLRMTQRQLHHLHRDSGRLTTAVITLIKYSYIHVFMNTLDP